MQHQIRFKSPIYSGGISNVQVIDCTDNRLLLNGTEGFRNQIRSIRFGIIQQKIQIDLYRGNNPFDNCFYASVPQISNVVRIDKQMLAITETCIPISIQQQCMFQNITITALNRSIVLGVNNGQILSWDLTRELEKIVYKPEQKIDFLSIRVLNGDLLLSYKKKVDIPTFYSIFDLEYEAETLGIKANGSFIYMPYPVIFDENKFAVVNHLFSPNSQQLVLYDRRTSKRAVNVLESNAINTFAQVLTTVKLNQNIVVLFGREANTQAKFIYSIDIRKGAIFDDRERTFHQRARLAVLKDNCVALTNWTTDIPRQTSVYVQQF